MKQKNIIEAIKCLTEMIAELQCNVIPSPNGEDIEKYIDDNKKDKWKRIRKILDIGEIEE